MNAISEKITSRPGFSKATLRSDRTLSLPRKVMKFLVKMALVALGMSEEIAMGQ